jgi:Ser/Thr protein kinase RdoA (MazF antagonist)
VSADALVVAALRRYGVRPRRIRPLAADVVRIDADNGQTFALRCRPRADRAFGNIPLEIAWMAALRSDTNIRPPEPVPGLDDALIQQVEVPEVPEPCDCVLFYWMPGPTLAARLTPENIYRMGELSARLHAHAATYRPPVEIPVRTLDELIGRGERDVLFSHEHPEFLPPSRRALFEHVAERFRETVAAIYADPTGRVLIHADLHPKNIKIHRSRLRPLDFYEVIWGYPVQDIALTLYDLRFFTDSRPYGYAVLREAFHRGYGSRLAWPETHAGQIDTLVAGRRLRQANWVLLHETTSFASQPAAVPDPAELHPFFQRLETEFRTLC